MEKGIGTYGDGLGGFTGWQNDPYFSFIGKANSLHIKRNEQYTMLFRKLQNEGTAFKDIKKRLLNHAKKVGIYKPTVGPWSEISADGTMLPTHRPYNELVKARVAWAVALSNFLSWVSRNWESYTEEKTASNSAMKPKTRQKILIDGTEYTITIRGIDDELFERWMMQRPVEEEVDPEYFESLVANNVVETVVCLQNVLDECEGTPREKEIRSLLEETLA